MKKKLDLVHFIKGLAVCFIIVLLLLSNIFIYTSAAIVKQNNNINYFELNNKTAVVSAQIIDTVDEYINILTEDGYKIIDYNLDIKNLSKTLFENEKQSEDEIKTDIKDNLNIKISAIKLIINNDENYYFQNNSKSKEFIDELNSYIEQKYSEEEVQINIKEISNQEIISNKKENVKAEKQKLIEIERQKELEEKRKKELEEQKRVQEEKNKREAYVVSSRGNVTRSNFRGGFPLASYVCISSPYGMRSGSMHTGVDLAASAGTHIYAWKSGKVIQAGWCGSYGNFIAIDHGDGTVSRYAHLSGYNCSVGQYVEQGYTIGYVGSTGNSTGPHLHWEIKVNGNFVNPVNYV